MEPSGGAPQAAEGKEVEAGDGAFGLGGAVFGEGGDHLVGGRYGDNVGHAGGLLGKQAHGRPDAAAKRVFDQGPHAGQPRHPDMDGQDVGILPDAALLGDDCCGVETELGDDIKLGCRARA